MVPLLAKTAGVLPINCGARTTVFVKSQFFFFIVKVVRFLEYVRKLFWCSPTLCMSIEILRKIEFNHTHTNSHEDVLR